MALRMQDFECEDCNKRTEVLLDSNNLEQIVECEHCHSTKMVKVISIGTGKGSHVSWSKWRTGV